MLSKQKIVNQDNFDDYLRQVAESRQNADTIRQRLVESALELNKIKKSYNQRSKDLDDTKIEISSLNRANKDLKNKLMQALIVKEELIIKKNNLCDMIDRTRSNIENMESESDITLRDDDVDCIRERYSISEQLSLVSKIQDARCKLLKYGFPPHMY